jgi:hypothetical protein
MKRLATRSAWWHKAPQSLNAVYAASREASRGTYWLLSSYLHRHHVVRTHLGPEKDAPDRRPVQPRATGKVIVLPQVSGLHHHYVRLAA